MKIKKSKKPDHRPGKGSIEIIEEATHLLRLMPVQITALYFIGGLPFILGLLYFVADMSKNAFAYEHDAEAVFSMVLLFLWMKCWQAVFCNHVRAFIAHAPAPKWSFLEIVRLCVAQIAIQPLGFAILPVAFIITLPFGYAYAFFQNVSLYGDGKSSGLKPVYKKALSQTKFFPRQNHALLLILTLFSFFIFFNVIPVMFFAPRLLQTFTGIETEFTLIGWRILFNTTFLTAAVALTYIAIDPLVKTVYVLRCFYGESLSTGEDLKIDLQRLRPAAHISALLIASFLILHTSFSYAGDTTMPVRAGVERTALSSTELDRSLSDTITKREYAWRLPRQQMTKKDHGPFAAFLDGVVDTAADWISAVEDWIDRALKWIRDFIIKPSLDKSHPDKSWTGSTTLLLYILGAIAVCLTAIFVWHTSKKRKTGTIELTGKALAPVHDLSSEEITADELPSNEWIALARRMAEKGDLRLALRALYLGSLAHLANHGIVRIAKYKSNRDYEMEVRRRAAETSDLIAAFSENSGIFESVWYGMHDIPAEVFKEFSQKHERIMTLADRY